MGSAKQRPCQGCEAYEPARKRAATDEAGHTMWGGLGRGVSLTRPSLWTSFTESGARLMARRRSVTRTGKPSATATGCFNS